jgi:hypothetical protein
MVRLLWLLAGLAFLAAGAWFLGGPPREYFLRQECARYHKERLERFNLLRFQKARADAATAVEIDRRTEELLRETRTFLVRGWRVVLVPAGALPPGPGHRLLVTFDPSAAGDPAPVRGPMAAWVRPEGWLARVFMRG